MKKKSFLFGAVALTLAGFISKFIGAFYRVPLLAILGSEGLGMYQLVFPIFALFLVVASSGVSITISKMVSGFVREGEQGNIKQLLKIALCEVVGVSVLFAIIIVLLAVFLSELQGNVSLKICYYALAPGLIFSGIISCFRGYYQGLGDMLPSSISQILEQILKLVFGLSLAFEFAKISVILAAFGALLGITISEFLVCIFMFVLYKVNNKKQNKIQCLERNNKVKLFKEFNKQLLPISFTNVIAPLFSAIDSVLIVGLLSNAGFNAEVATRLFGINSGMISSIVTLPTVLATAIATSVVPVINSQKESANVVIKLAIKIIFIFCLPVSIFYIVFGNNIASLLYSSLNVSGVSQAIIAGNLLRINGINTFYLSFISITTAVLQINNKSRYAIRNQLIASIFKLLLTVVLVTKSSFNIYGLAIAEVLGFSITCVLNLKEIKKVYPVYLSIKEGLIVPAVSCIFSVLSMRVLQRFFSLILPSKFAFVMFTVFGVIVYLIIIVSSKIFSKAEFNKLKFTKVGQ